MRNFDKANAPTGNSLNPLDQRQEEINYPTDSEQNTKVPILMYHHIRNYNDPSDKIGTNLSVPIDNFKTEIEYLKNNGYKTITFEDLLSFPVKKLPEKPIILTFDDGYQDVYDNAFPLLKANSFNGTFYIISSKIGTPEFMTADEITEMSKNNMEIGSHTATHPDLTTIGKDKIKTELSESKTALEKIIGKKVFAFCYPSGKFSSEIEKDVKNSGYTSATTTKSGISRISNDKFSLVRIRINSNDSIETFVKKLQ